MVGLAPSGFANILHAGYKQIQVFIRPIVGVLQLAGCEIIFENHPVSIGHLARSPLPNEIVSHDFCHHLEFILCHHAFTIHHPSDIGKKIGKVAARNSEAPALVND